MGSTVLEPDAPGYVDPLEAMLKPPSAPFFSLDKNKYGKTLPCKGYFDKKVTQ
jgi:hypothetical protein